MARTRIPTVQSARPGLLSRMGGAVMSAFGLGGDVPSNPHHGASVSRRLGGWRPTGSGPNSVVQSSQPELIRRSRDMARNNPHGKRAISLVSTHTVGMGIKPRSLCSDAGVRDALMALWAKWTDIADADGVLDFYGIQALAVAEMAEGGECFARLRPRRMSEGLPVPLQIQLIPTEQVPIDYCQPNGSNSVTQGIERDAIGRRVAYWMYQQHPGELATNGVVDAFPRRVTADSVVHLYNIARIGQLRGLPWLAAAITTLHQIDAYVDAELLRKQMTANIVAFVKKATGKAVDEEELAAAWGEVIEKLGGLPDVALEAGTIQYLDLDEDVVINQTADVGGNYQAFITSAYQKAAMALDLMPDELTGDFAGGNERSYRAKLITFKRRIRQIQHHIVCHQFNRPIWERFVADAVAFGSLKLPRGVTIEDALKVEWRAERWEYVNAKQDVEAVAAEIDAGLISRESAVAERGDDIETIDAQRASDKAREERLGVPVAAGAKPAAPIPPDDEDEAEDTPPAKGKE